MGLIRAVAVLPIDKRFRTPSLELKCLGTSFGGGKRKLFNRLELNMAAVWLRPMVGGSVFIYAQWVGHHDNDIDLVTFKNNQSQPLDCRY